MRINKKIKPISIFVIVGILFITLGVSVAFFNYTRTGNANIVTTGRVNFISEEAGNITLTNVFPINSEETETDTTNAKSMTIIVEGDTDYSEGIEYLISTNNDATNGAIGIFNSCPSLATIYVSNLWNLSNQPSAVPVFSDNTSLAGGNGTRFNSSKNTVTMAVIDNSEHEGYLTLAS